jgi:hypothetical protein
MTSTVPFYLRLVAPSASISALLRPVLVRGRSNQLSEPPIRVYIKRQVVAQQRGVTLARSYEIAEGRLERLPSSLSQAETEMETAEYEGELRCNRAVTVGGFDVGRLRVSVRVGLWFKSMQVFIYVQDFVVLAITPTGANSFFEELMHAQAIRIVTG